MYLLSTLRRWATLALALTLAAITLSSTEQEEVNGEEAYNQYCKSCHRAGGKGFFKLYPPLDDPQYLNNDSLMVAIITNGLSGPITVSGKEYDREMAAIEGITPAEISAVVNYMRQEFINSSQTVSLQDVKKWRQRTE